MLGRAATRVTTQCAHFLIQPLSELHLCGRPASLNNGIPIMGGDKPGPGDSQHYFTIPPNTSKQKSGGIQLRLLLFFFQ